MDKEGIDNVIYSNVVSILSISEDDVEIGLCLRNPDGSAQVKHRLFFSTSHFDRVVDLFNKLNNEIKNK